MSSFWVRVSLVCFSIVCSSSYSHLSSYGQYGHYSEHYHGHQYQTEFGNYPVVDDLPHASHETYAGYDDPGHYYDDDYYPPMATLCMGMTHMEDLTLGYGYYPPH